jgi:hypothetical protein
MGLRADPVFTTDRVASTAAASGLTIATALLVLASVPPRFAPVPAPVPAHAAVRAADRITYVSPVAALPVTNIRPAVPAKTRTSPRPRPAAPTHEQVTQTSRPVAPDSSAGAPASASATRSSVSDFERRWTAHGVSPLLLPGPAPEPAYAGGAASTRATMHVLNSAVDRDAQLRAKESEDRAARAAGAPLPITPRGGISIDAPLPFGGPSRAERKRDSTINAQTKAILVRVRQRLDSIAAARRRQRADSLGSDDKRR